MTPLPTLLKRSLEIYAGRRSSDDDFLKYRALELAYTITIKYVGTTFALIAADVSDELKHESWSSILSSSSLGGWLRAIECVCKGSKSLPPNVRDFCDLYTLSKKHPQKGRLDRISQRLNEVISQLEGLGYQIQPLTSPNIRRILEVAVQIRNKCAHGVLEPPFFSQIEKSFHAALRDTLGLIPFSSFEFLGKYGSRAYRFVEVPTLVNRSRNAYFWAESSLLKEGYSDDIPFINYIEGTQAIYFLNDVPDNGTAEFIDYMTGQVRQYEVSFDWQKNFTKPEPRALRPRKYRSHREMLEGCSSNWRRILISQEGIATATVDEAGVYVFTAQTKVASNKEIEVVLYVGKTTSLHSRLTHYIKIQKGYDTSRPELANMFEIYGHDVRLFFLPLPASQLSAVERAIYEVMMPEYNLVAPPE